MEGFGSAIERERRLHNATLSGNVESLKELMQEDELTLARVSLTCFNETPLHVATMLGHVDFVNSLLSYKPDLVTKLDSQGRSPMHLASASGHVDLVKVLLLVDSDVCLLRDKERKTPLHLAVMHGHVEVVKELIQARPQVVTQYVLDRGETILHTCVKHNHLDVLKVCVGELTRMGCDEEFVNVRDDYGFTILHMATALKQIETIKFLVSRGSKVRVNAKNGNGLTSLDMMDNMPRDLKTVDIIEVLVKAGCRREKDVILPHPVLDQILVEHVDFKEEEKSETDTQKTEKISLLSRVIKEYKKKGKRDSEWVEKERNSIMVTATVIAGMAYQAALNPPGGVWDQNHREGDIVFLAGTSIIASNFPYYYNRFWIFNTISFATSLSIILLLVSGIPIKGRIFMWVLMFTMWLTLSFTTLSYLTAMEAITPGHEGFETEWGATERIVSSLLYSWLGLIGLVFLVNTCRFISWIIKKVMKPQKKMIERA